jgi:hypothetical protein
MSRVREIWVPPEPVAGVWKASKHRLVGNDHSRQYIEAMHEATWKRVNPFDFYRPPERRIDQENCAAHEYFSKLADMALEFAPTDEQSKLFRNSVRVLADLYGLLGLWREEFDTPLPPEHDLRTIVLVVPDTIIDAAGRLHEIDPPTEGKECLERHLYEQDKRIFSDRGENHLLKQIVLNPDDLILPEELRFQRKAQQFMSGFLARPLSFGEHPKSRTASYEDVQREYGVRVLFDRNVPAGASLMFTREPIHAWRSKLRGFAQDPTPGRLNANLEGVTPRIVVGDDGEPADTWSCPSLLKALYLMIYVDIRSGVRLQKCQAPGCAEYFRIGPRSRKSLYCPPPPGNKESKCASRASSQMYRERQRRKENDTT